MATSIAVVGASGSGKSASLRNLPTEQTVIISPYKEDVSFIPTDGKRYIKYIPGVSDKSVKSTANFIVLPKDEGTYQLSYIPEIVRSMAQRPHVKYIVLEDITHWMHDYTTDFEFVRKERTSDKWSRWEHFGRDMFNALFTATKGLRDDLWLIFMFHSSEDSSGKQVIKTSGQMLDRNIDIPSYFNTVLHTIVHPFDPKNADKERYFFLTNDDGDHLAKSKMGAFDSMLIPNDMAYVIEKLNA